MGGKIITHMSHAVLNVNTDNCRDAFYVGRMLRYGNTSLGNPYAIGRDGDRKTVIEKYRVWLSARIAEPDPVVCTALLSIQKNQSLFCHCTPQECHGEVISAIVDDAQSTLRHHPQKTFRYAGIGSRSTPQPVLDQMEKVAHRLSELGYTLLSGGADGADSAFESGCFGNKEIYLPWPNFRHLQGRHYVTLPTTEAFRVASVVHPAWSRLKDSAKSLMARNSHQVLGANLRSP